MSILAKLRQFRLAVATPRVTLTTYHAPPAGFRGLPTLHGERCVGCGACAHVCPSRLITLAVDGARCTLTADLGRCTYCARCAEVCPSEAFLMSNRYETAVTDPAALRIQAVLQMAFCPDCGKPLGTTRH
ncbi:MAG TPA: 4Fe-4S dicluster domain-containing protein, partial [Symbiobacteriaceae bacterium]|nr:4Fe-4S dicluster domain-containing protein [Symbiobacteriaceae bacterium]